LRALSIRTSSTFLPCWLSKAWQAQWPDLPMSAQKDNTRPDKESCHFFWTSDWSQFKFQIVTVVNKTQLWMTAVRIRAWQPATGNPIPSPVQLMLLVQFGRSKLKWMLT
jgi:hypothetical protein